MTTSQWVKRSLSGATAALLLSGSLVPLAFAETMSPSGTQLNQSVYTNGTSMQSETTLSSPGAYVLPSGTSLTLRPVSMSTLNTGDNFTATVASPVQSQGVTVIPAGSQVNGTVVGVNSVANTADIQFQQITTSNGQTVPIQSHATVNRLIGSVQQQAIAANTTSQNGVYRAGSYFPHVIIGREGASPGAKIVGGTVGGAAFGAATGALGGVIIPAVYRHDVNFSEGTGALRGAAWGAAVGSGLGLISGLIAAASDRRSSVATTTTSVSSTRPVTNITTGALEEVPVGYTASGGAAGTNLFTITLEQPATVMP